MNYEVLVNCLSGNLVDFADTKIHEIPYDCSKPSKELLTYLESINMYTKDKF